MVVSSSYDSLKNIIFDNLRTSDATLYFIKNFESYMSGKSKIDTIKTSYPFLKEVKLDQLEKSFSKLRSDLISRKKIKIQAPIILSNKLIDLIYEKISKDTGKYMLDCFLDSSIVSGLKITVDGNLIDLTLENLNKGKI